MIVARRLDDEGDRLVIARRARERLVSALPPGLPPALRLAGPAHVASDGSSRGELAADGPCELLDWAASGLMFLTGWPGRAPLGPPGPVTGGLRAIARLLGDLAAASGRRLDTDVPSLVSGRAALLGLARSGRRSAGGSCRLLAAADGWVAVNLARPDDEELAMVAVDGGEAVREGEATPVEPGRGRSARPGMDPWSVLAGAAARKSGQELAERLQLFGVPAAVAPRWSLASADAGPIASASEATPPLVVRPLGRPARPGLRQPLVVDLSSMWAGPLCAHLLGRAGARVIKVESTARPDGARRGDPSFYDWLHAGHESVALDLSSAEGVHALRSLLGVADVVVEASRPRALSQLGIDAEASVATSPGKIWVSITGYGRTDDDGQRVAFGDDAAVAGGLVGRDHAGLPVFCGDAMADPVSGLLGALGAMGSLTVGGGHLVEISMARAARFLAVPERSAGSSCGPTIRRVGGDRWIVHCRHGEAAVALPVAPPPAPPAQPLGADTATVVDALLRDVTAPGTAEEIRLGVEPS